MNLKLLRKIIKKLPIDSEAIIVIGTNGRTKVFFSSAERLDRKKFKLLPSRDIYTHGHRYQVRMKSLIGKRDINELLIEGKRK